MMTMLLTNNHRSLSSSSSNFKKGNQGDNLRKQQAIKRQMERAIPVTEESSSSSSFVPPALSPIRPSSSAAAASSSSTQGSSFFGTGDVTTGLARLRIQTPKMKSFYLEDNHNDHPNENSQTTTSSIILPTTITPTWESNKQSTLMVPMGSNSIGRKNDGTTRLPQNNGTVDEDDNEMGFEIDRESLYDPKIHLPHAPQDWKGYESATPLSDYLMQRIGVSGQPITTAEYMRHALTHPQYGYYTTTTNTTNSTRSTKKNQTISSSKDNDDYDHDDWDDSSIGDTSSSSSSDNTLASNTIFGPTGDFVTAPEISSVFGHCLCVWFMTQWQTTLYKQKQISFVELGPGKGTLMADIIELAHSSKLIDFGQCIASIHLIEASETLRMEQRATLTRVVGHLVKLEFVDSTTGDHKMTNDKRGDKTTATTKGIVNTIRVQWHNDFTTYQKKRDRDVPTMIILQEFLDALPVHQFQKTDEGWRERMIDVVAAEDEHANREAIERIAHQSSSSSSNDGDSSAPGSSRDGRRALIPRLRQVLAPQVTPAVELLLSTNMAYDQFPENTVIEICPDALLLVEDIVTVLEESTGAALIIDYGEDGTTDTLRAFSRHRQVPLTSRPGQVDVTADVDFFALKNCVSSRSTTTTKHLPPSTSSSTATTPSTTPIEIYPFGPVPQGEFLMKMGAGDLAMNAIERDETTEEEAQAIADAFKYLVMPEHMGTKFKVLALARKRDGLFAPPGME
jgi:NADH dehydrogenase [ubiquinone] 1 alpha subcomplex assembly factor 7